MTIIPIIAAFMGGGFVGFFACAVLTAGKLAATQTWSDFYEDCLLGSADGFVEIHDAHARCADALTTVQGKITDIRDLIDDPRTISKADIRTVLGDA